VSIDLRLDPPVFPARTRMAVIVFWLVYWWWFFALLPWMLARQIVMTVKDWWWAWRTAGRTYRFLDGRLVIGFVGNQELLVTAGMFGERFTWLRWDDVVIDPGPARFRGAVLSGLATEAVPAVVVCTHAHEEHIGNAAVVARMHGIPVLAAALTCDAVRQPPLLPAGRLLLMGQAEVPGPEVRVETIGERVTSARGVLDVIAADGHCSGHIVLFARSEGVLFAGDAFLHELFTSPNADADHRAWITTLERLSALPVRTLVGAHGAILTCDPAMTLVPGVVHAADPRQLIAAKLAFLRWAQAVVDEGEVRGLSYSVIEATLFPWQRGWAWRTWFHDEGFRLLTCGEFSRTHLVRSLSATPARVPVRFPAFLRLAKPLAALGPELLRIHLLAARPEPVLVIAGSIVLSAAVLVLAAQMAGSAGHLPSSLVAAAPHLIQHAAWGWLATVLAAWVLWWSVIGGAITRRMALAIAGTPAEGWGASLRWCLRPGLLVPSSLASLCLLAVAVAGVWSWCLVAVPPVWLVAGVLYAGCCLPPGRLTGALADLVALLRNPWPFLRRQTVFLLGFGASTGVVYLLAGAWWAVLRAVTGSWTAPVTLLVAAPALVYALGYTTANLKSLQIWLYLRRHQP
jgi:hydroxyacylglutathione hydrolase